MNFDEAADDFKKTLDTVIEGFGTEIKNVLDSANLTGLETTANNYLTLLSNVNDIIDDTIEVKSAYVNQRGCANPDSVEFKGEDLGVDILLEETTNMSPDVYTYEQIPTDWDASFDPQLNNYQQGNLGFSYINTLLCLYSFYVISFK